MSLDKNKPHYSNLAKIFHWVFVIIFIYGVVKQVDDINQLDDFAFFRFEIIFALIFLFLLVIRFIYMKKTQKSSLPEDTSKVQKIIAKIVHNGMYLLLAGTAISGLLIGLLYWLGNKEGIIIDTIIYMHEILINFLYYFIAIHVAASLYHRFKRDRVWNSMVPFFKINNK